MVNEQGAYTATAEDGKHERVQDGQHTEDGKRYADVSDNVCR